MSDVTIKRIPECVSREFVTCWVRATLSVFALHNKALEGSWTITTKDLSKETNEVTGGGVGGLCWGDRKLIEIGTVHTKPSQIVSVIVHELIHACFGDFGEGTNEKCTSTLTAKMIPIIKPIADSMMEDYYRVKAYIAHTKPGMAYPTKEGGADSYDDNQWAAASGVKDTRKKDIPLKSKPLLFEGLFDNLFG